MDGTPSQPKYYQLPELIEQIEGQNGAIAHRIYEDHKDLFEATPGASRNHHAWPGGYADHVTEVMNLAASLFDTLNAARKLPFTKSDALLVMFLHDIEKPFRYTYAEDGSLIKKSELDQKSAKKAKRQELINHYGFELTSQQVNALKYVETVPDVEYTPDARLMGELAALCHCADSLSARLWYNYPLPQGQDTWGSAARINPRSNDYTIPSELEN